MLHTGQCREGDDLTDPLPPQEPDLPHGAGLREPHKGVGGNADARKVLGDHRSLRGSGHAPVQPDHKPEIQGNIQQGGNSQKGQGNHGIADGPQKRGKVVIQKNSGNAHKNDEQVPAHIPPHLGRDPEKCPQSIQAGKGQDVQQQGDQGNKEKGRAEILAKSLLIPLAKAHGEQRPAAHAQAKNNGGQEGHQRKGRAHGRKGVPAQKLPHNQRVGNVIALLQ